MNRRSLLRLLAWTPFIAPFASKVQAASKPKAASDYKLIGFDLAEGGQQPVRGKLYVMLAKYDDNIKMLAEALVRHYGWIVMYDTGEETQAKTRVLLEKGMDVLVVAVSAPVKLVSNIPSVCPTATWVVQSDMAGSISHFLFNESDLVFTITGHAVMGTSHDMQTHSYSWSGRTLLDRYGNGSAGGEWLFTERVKDRRAWFGHGHWGYWPSPSLYGFPPLCRPGEEIAEGTWVATDFHYAQ